MAISEARDHLTPELFHELAASTWRNRIRQRDDEDMPDLPDIDSFRVSIIERGLDEGLPEFYERISLVDEVYDLDSLFDSDEIYIGMEGRNEVYIVARGSKIRLDSALIDRTDLVLIAYSLEGLHYEWAKATELSPDLKHPLPPLIEQWFKRPRTIAAHDGDNGVLPYEYGRLRDLTPPEQTAMLPEIMALDKENYQRSPQLAFDLEDKPPRLPTTPATLFDDVSSIDRRTPLPLRMFTEILMLLDQHGRCQSDGRPVRIEMNLGEFGDWLYDSGFNVARHYQRLIEAMHIIEQIRLPVLHNGELTLLRPISFPYMPVRSRRSTVVFQVELPATDNAAGALLHKPSLRSLSGSVRRYRFYQGVAYLDNISGRNGKPVNPFKPRMRTDDAGYLLDINGVHLRERGRPTDRYTVKTPGGGALRPGVVFEDTKGNVVQNAAQAAQIDNPDAWQYARRLTIDDLIDLFYPRGARLGASPRTLRDMRWRALNDLRAMERDRIIVVREVEHDRKGTAVSWKIKAMPNGISLRR